MSKSPTSILLSLAVLCGWVVLAAVLVEVGARVVSPWPASDAVMRSSITGMLFAHDPALVHAPRAGASVTVWDPEYQAHVRFNGLGVRGPEPSPMGASGRRVLVVGDSFALGMQVDEAQTFTEQMQVQMSEDVPTQVWNAGVDDYGTWQAHSRAVELMERGLNFDALVLVFYLGNDLVDNLRRRRKQGRRRNQPTARPQSPPALVTMAWWQLIEARLKLSSEPGHRERLTREVQFWCDDSATQGLLEPTRRSLTDLASMANQADLPLLIVLAPPQIVVDPAQGSALAESLGLTGFDPTRLTRQVVELIPAGTRVVDLTEPLQEASRSKRMHLRYDGHWNPDGHTLVAEVLSAEVAAMLDPS